MSISKMRNDCFEKYLFLFLFQKVKQRGKNGICLFFKSIGPSSYYHIESYLKSIILMFQIMIPFYIGNIPVFNRSLFLYLFLLVPKSFTINHGSYVWKGV